MKFKYSDLIIFIFIFLFLNFLNSDIILKLILLFAIFVFYRMYYSNIFERNSELEQILNQMKHNFTINSLIHQKISNKIKLFEQELNSNIFDSYILENNIYRRTTILNLLKSQSFYVENMNEFNILIKKIRTITNLQLKNYNLHYQNTNLNLESVKPNPIHDKLYSDNFNVYI